MIKYKMLHHNVDALLNSAHNTIFLHREKNLTSLTADFIDYYAKGRDGLSIRNEEREQSRGGQTVLANNISSWNAHRR
jgi:hypothetical protein